MSTPIKVSVVIPVFNGEDSIQRAIASVVAQTEQDFEIIVVDDCSTDRTGDIVAAMSRADERVRLLRTSVNSGPSGARNLGFAAARGTWIAILDADDAFKPERLATLIASGDRHGLDMVADGLIFFDYTAQREVRTRRVNTSGEFRGFDLTDFLKSCLFRVPLADLSGRPILQYALLKFMFRRAFILRHGLTYPSQYRDNEDFMFYAECMLAGAKSGLVTPAMYIYSQRFGEISKTSSHVARTPRDRTMAVAAVADLLRRHAARMTPEQRKLLDDRRRQALGLQAIEASRRAMAQRKVIPALLDMAKTPEAWAFAAQAALRRLTGVKAEADG